MHYSEYYNLAYFRKILHAHPELFWFLDQSVEETQDYAISPPFSWTQWFYQALSENIKFFPLVESTGFFRQLSEKIKLSSALGKRSIELERTILSLMILDALLRGDYEFCTESVLGPIITKKQFHHLISFLNKYFPSDNQREVLRTKIVLADLGKIRSVREYLSKQFSIVSQDHDQFMDQLLKQDYSELIYVLPSIHALDENSFSLLAAMSIEFNFAQFGQGESRAKALSGLKTKIKTEGFDNIGRAMFVSLLDVVGAAAQNHKLLLNSWVFSTYFEDMWRVFQKLENYPEETVHDAYLIQRLIRCEYWLPEQSPIILSIEERWFARLICMLRIYDRAAAQSLEEVFTELLKEVNFYQDMQRWASDDNNGVSRSIPPLLKGLVNHFTLTVDQTKIHRLGSALKMAFALIALSLRSHAYLVQHNQLSSQHPVNFNGLTRLLASDFEGIQQIANNRDATQLAFDKANNTAYPLYWAQHHLPLDQWVGLQNENVSA